MLIVVLTRRAGNEDPTTVATMPELFTFGLWDSDHLAIPRPTQVVVRRDRVNLHLTIMGSSWGSCETPGGTDWATTNTCLVGVTEGIAHLRDQKAAEALVGRLPTQQAVIATAKVTATPLAIRLSHSCRISQLHRVVGCTQQASTTDTHEEGAP